MRFLKTAAIAAALFGCAMAAAADPATPQTPPAAPTQPAAPPAPVEAAKPAAAPAEQENVRVCKTMKVIGSRTRGERLCKTRKQWRAEEEAARKAMDDNSRRALQACIPTAGGGCGG
jgi:hypothetical protein